MLCPKVWDFKSPKNYNEVTRWCTSKTEVSPTIRDHYYNHSISVVLPHSKEVPAILTDSILVDSDYYKIFGLPVSQLIDKGFIEAFVRKGELTLLSINKRIDLDNSICLTPKGQLILSLVVEDYQRLGIEGKRSYFDRAKPTRYVVTIDLKEDAFTPGKRNYERVRDCLNNNFDEKFDVIFVWDPPEKYLCPSSAAAWFHQRGHKVSLCRQKYSEFFEDSSKIPLLDKDCNEREFFEWLGIFSIGGDVKNEDPENYLNSYTCPLQNVIDGKIICAEWTGLFSIKRLNNIYESIKNYLASNNNTSTPWMSLHVHGFADSPVSWCLKEHSYYTDGDNSFTIVFQRNGEQIIQKSLSSNNKPRIVQ